MTNEVGTYDRSIKPLTAKVMKKEEAQIKLALEIPVVERGFITIVCNGDVSTKQNNFEMCRSMT